MVDFAKVDIQVVKKCENCGKMGREVLRHATKILKLQNEILFLKQQVKTLTIENNMMRVKE